LLFLLDAETAHGITLKSLALFNKLHLLKTQVSGQPVQIMNLNFTNRVGLAAGLDKNGNYIDALAKLGFGFIEVGTVTPRPQPGNPKPRLFRIPQKNALINRMGFNNDGIDTLISNIKRAKYKGVLGINIGKNFDTPNERATDDYLTCLEKAYPYASYIVINISSPNTKNLRELQYGESLKQLLKVLKQNQKILAEQHNRYVPLLVKVAPDLSSDEIKEIATAMLEMQMDGLIATNTSISRDLVSEYAAAKEAGGLSGQPVFEKSLAVVKQFSAILQGKMPIIAVGGIDSREKAQAMLDAGASLLQLYSGLIYEGPTLIQKII